MPVDSGSPLSGHCEIPGRSQPASGPGPRQKLPDSWGRSFTRISKKTREVGALTNLQAKTHHDSSSLSPAMTCGLAPSNNGKEEQGDCLHGSLRVRTHGVRVIPRKPDHTLSSHRPQTEVGTTFQDVLCSAHLCPSLATHLVSPCNDLQHL